MRAILTLLEDDGLCPHKYGALEEYDSCRSASLYVTCRAGGRAGAGRRAGAGGRAGAGAGGRVRNRQWTSNGRRKENGRQRRSADLLVVWTVKANARSVVVIFIDGGVGAAPFQLIIVRVYVAGIFCLR